MNEQMKSSFVYLCEGNSLKCQYTGNPTFTYFDPPGARHTNFVKQLHETKIPIPQLSTEIIFNKNNCGDLLQSISTNCPLSLLSKAELWVDDLKVDWVDNNIISFLCPNPSKEFVIPFGCLRGNNYLPKNTNCSIKVKLTYTQPISTVYHADVLLDTEEHRRICKLPFKNHIEKWYRFTAPTNSKINISKFAGHTGDLVSNIVWRYKKPVGQGKIKFSRVDGAFHPIEYSLECFNIHEKQHTGMTHLSEEWYLKSFELNPFSVQSSGIVCPGYMIMEHTELEPEPEPEVELYVHCRTILELEPDTKH